MKIVKNILKAIIALLISIFLLTLLWLYLTREQPIQTIDNSYYIEVAEYIKIRNSFFESFSGTNKSYKDVYELMFRIDQSNDTEDASNAYGRIVLEGITNKELLDKRKRYNVDIVDYYENGSIKTIKIEEQ